MTSPATEKYPHVYTDVAQSMHITVRLSDHDPETALGGGTVIGRLTTLGDFSQDGLRRTPDYQPVIVTEIFVRPEYRRRGIGTMLLEALKQRVGHAKRDIMLSNEDVGVISLVSKEHRLSTPESLRFYRANGFEFLRQGDSDSTLVCRAA